VKDGAGDNGFLFSTAEAFANTRIGWYWCALEMDPSIYKKTGILLSVIKLNAYSISIHQWR